MPIRGHSGVQGGAEMGAYATAFPGGKPVNAENAAALSNALRLPSARLARPHRDRDGRGLRARRTRSALLPRRQFPPHAARTRITSRAPWRTCRCACTRTSSSPTRCSSTRSEEVMLLPAKTRYEQDDGGTETTTERRIAFSPEIPRQVGEARAEWKILRDLAGRFTRSAPICSAAKPAGKCARKSRASCRSTMASKTCARYTHGDIATERAGTCRRGS